MAPEEHRTYIYIYIYIYIKYIKGTTTIIREGAAAVTRQAAERNEGAIFKNCAPFCIGEITNTQTDNAKDLNVIMPMYNLII